MMARVQTLSRLHFFLFTQLFITTFHNSLFLYIGFSDRILSFLPHLFYVYCSVHIENLLSSDIGIGIGNYNFLANISVIGILENSISVHL